MFRKIATELWRNEQFTNVAITHERRLHSKLTKLQQRVGTRLRYEQVEFGVTRSMADALTATGVIM
jgi:hypothetical protein